MENFEQPLTLIEVTINHHNQLFRKFLLWFNYTSNICFRFHLEMGGIEGIVNIITDQSACIRQNAGVLYAKLASL